MDGIRFQAKILEELSKRPNGKIIDLGSGLLKVKAGGAVSGIRTDWVGVLVNEGFQCFYGKFLSVDETANEFVFKLRSK